jgi:protein-disulfide isomerase
MTEQEVKKYFLFGSIGLGAIIVAGLALAILSGPDSAERPKGTVEKGLVFNDDNDPGFGPGESTFKVRIFSDFQCPACKMAEAAADAARQKYGDRVRFIWNDFPLPSLHRNARPAALAARCAEDQGKFWEYHGKLFGQQEEWSPMPAPASTFQKYAKEIGLDEEVFASCLADQRFLRKVQDDEAEGERLGVEGTPTFFIGNKRFVGAMEFADWEAEIEEMLAGS